MTSIVCLYVVMTCSKYKKLNVENLFEQHAALLNTMGGAHDIVMSSRELAANVTVITMRVKPDCVTNVCMVSEDLMPHMTRMHLLRYITKLILS